MLRLIGGSIAAFALATTAVHAQQVDCTRLQQQIAQAGRGGGAGGNRYAGAARRQAGELARTQALAHQLGCDSFTFFGGNPQCGGLNGRIAQMQANLAQLQAAAGGAGSGSEGGKAELVARYNALCVDGQPRQRGFFESLFGGPPAPQAPVPDLPAERRAPDESAGEGGHTRSGSQAVCVRSCDGSFFPLGVSARRDSASLTEMCHALCPGTETAVFTRNPDSDIRTAVGIDGKPYMDLPNALKYQKTLAASCSCRPPGKDWAETLASAEEVLDNVRKGDVIVTKEKSDALSRPNLDAKARAAILKAEPVDADQASGPHPDRDKTADAALAHAGSDQGEARRPAMRSPKDLPPDDDGFDEPMPDRRRGAPPY